MRRFFENVFSIQLVLCINYFLVIANPLIGDKVSPAQDGQFPFVVSMAKAPGNTTGSHFCTGTLITKRHVLTAAHCVEKNNKTESFMDPSKVVITVGSNDVTLGTKYKVQKWKNFEEWALEKNIIINTASNLFHDIAVVTLVNNVIEDIKPANLSNLKIKDLYGKSVVAAGWGKTNFGISPRFLQRADLQVLNKKTCVRNLKATALEAVDSLNHLCTIARPPISLGCGDSGGPILINRNEVVGVNVGNCADHNDPHQMNLHASVKFYRKFILDTIA